MKKLFLLSGISRELSKEEWQDIIYHARLNSRRKTTQEFIKELHKVNASIQVIGEYLNNNTPIECECRICGNKWKSTPSTLLSGSGCLVCSKNRLSKERTKSHLEFAEQIELCLPNVILLEQYKNLKTKIKCQCKECGNIWYAYPGNLLKGCGCRKCSYKLIANKNRKNEDEFKKEMQKINPNIIIMSQYLGANYNVDVICKDCGYSWSPRAADLLHNRGCPVCSRKKVALSSRKNNKTFISELHTINNTILPLEEYKTSNKKISVKCTVCNYTWDVTPKSLLQGNGCPKCARIQNAKSREKAIEQYSLTGELICTFDNCKEASKNTNSSLTGIQAVARGDRKTCNGFVWRYVNKK